MPYMNPSWRQNGASFPAGSPSCTNTVLCAAQGIQAGGQACSLLNVVFTGPERTPRPEGIKPGSPEVPGGSTGLAPACVGRGPTRASLLLSISHGGFTPEIFFGGKVY